MFSEQDPFPEAAMLRRHVFSSYVIKQHHEKLQSNVAESRVWLCSWHLIWNVQNVWTCWFCICLCYNGVYLCSRLVDQFAWLVLINSSLPMESTIRFGTTSGPCRTATSERAQLVEDMGKLDVLPQFKRLVLCFSRWMLMVATFGFFKDDKGNCDPDKLLQCPFDKNHLIRSCRFPYHLIKCRKVSRLVSKYCKTAHFYYFKYSRHVYLLL